jgi:hypothetical protein
MRTMVESSSRSVRGQCTVFKPILSSPSFQRQRSAAPARLDRAWHWRPDPRRQPPQVPCIPRDTDHEADRGRKLCAFPRGEAPYGEARRVVHAIDLLDAPPRHQAVVDHRLATCTWELAWIKEADRLTRKDGAAGIDGVTARDFAQNIEDHPRGRGVFAGRRRSPILRRHHLAKGPVRSGVATYAT